MISPPSLASVNALQPRPRPGFGPRTLLLFAAAVFGLASKPCHAIDLRGPETDVLQGRVDAAAAALLSITAADPNNGPAHLLLCRAYLSEELAGKAADECAKALQSGLAQSSDAQDWAGRAFGRQAERAGPLTGLRLAGQVRTAFQTAHKLAPHSPAAANDLGEFYIAAPFIVGGGSDKADTLIGEIRPSLPEIAHRLRAMLAEKGNDAATAEREFMAATQTVQSPGAYVDLSTFYMREKRSGDAAQAAVRAIALDRDLDANAVEAASSLADAGQDRQAIATLRAYLARGSKSDQAPAFRVHTLIAHLLERNGDKAGARAEFTQALAMASGYVPAQKGLAAL